MTMRRPREMDSGTLTFRDWTTWYRISGDLDDARRRERAPLVVLHGGPGFAHDYLLPLAALAKSGRPVVHYDQLGCGRSTHLPDASSEFWTVELFLEELDNLLDGLALADGYHLLGHSWGGALAAEHAVRRPSGLRTLTIADAPASMDMWVAEADRLRAALPKDVQDVLLRHEQEDTTRSPEYQHAVDVFLARHVCRVEPMPDELARSVAQMVADPTVYLTMNGPSEFHVTGTLRRWSIVERLHSISVPTLLVNGRHDEATEVVMRPFADRVPDFRWHVFENSSHLPHLEETAAYLEVIRAFLEQQEAAGGTTEGMAPGPAPGPAQCATQHE